MSKNVIIFIPSIEDGGVEKNLFIVSNYLIRQKIRLRFLHVIIIKKNFDKNIKLIGTKNSFWFNKSRKIKYAVCLLLLFFYLLKKGSNDLVFAFQANIYAIIVAKLTGSKVITRSNSSPSGWSKNFLKKKFYGFIIKLANGVMVNSNQFKTEFKNIFNINVRCIFNPFDKSFFKKKNF